MKKEFEYEGYKVTILVIEPKGIWAMIRRADIPGRQPFVALKKDVINVTKHDENEK